MRYFQTQIFIAGGSLGGVAAAYAAARNGTDVILAEETGWLGGQATAQGVPPDEQPWTEHHGRNESYQLFRQKVRAYYKRNYPMPKRSENDPLFSPGAAWVNSFSFEPKVGQYALYEMLMPYITSGTLRIMLHTRLVKAEMTRDRCTAVHCSQYGEQVIFQADYYLDATEMGDLLPLTGTENRYGAESRNETGEPLAPEQADPMRQQAFTHLAAVAYQPGEDHSIEKPQGYEKWRERFVTLIGYAPPQYTQAEKLKERRRILFEDAKSTQFQPTIWNYRRSFCASNFDGFSSDITMLLTIFNGLSLPLIGVDEATKQNRLTAGKELTLSLLYYLQHEIENGWHGRVGFPGIRLRTDAFDTPDGMAVSPYTRESRRILAEYTVTECDFRIDRHPTSPLQYDDSIGIGGFMVDIFAPATQQAKAGATINEYGNHWVQQIPLRALVPVRVENILPACKNTGATHVMNGAFRLHPVEWAVGEASGCLAAWCVQKKDTPRHLVHNGQLATDFRAHLEKQGVQTSWQHFTAGTNSFSYYQNDPAWHYYETKRYRR